MPTPIDLTHRGRRRKKQPDKCFLHDTDWDWGVMLSSGMAMWKNRVVDWAFVKLNSDIPFRPNVMPNIPLSLDPSKFGLRLNYREGGPLAGFDQLKENEWYCNRQIDRTD